MHWISSGKTATLSLDALQNIILQGKVKQLFNRRSVTSFSTDRSQINIQDTAGLSVNDSCSSLCFFCDPGIFLSCQQCPPRARQDPGHLSFGQVLVVNRIVLHSGDQPTSPMTIFWSMLMLWFPQRRSASCPPVCSRLGLFLLLLICVDLFGPLSSGNQRLHSQTPWLSGVAFCAFLLAT